MKHILTASAAVLALSVMCACGSQDPPAPAPRPTTSATPTVSPSTTNSAAAVPTMPALARQPTKAGAIAFTKYYWEVADYGQATLNTAPLRRLRLEGCGQCDGAEQWLSEIRTAGGRIEGADNSVKVLDVFIPKLNRQTALVTFRVTSTAGRVIGAGRLNKTYRQGTSRGQFTLSYQKSGWVVADWRVS